MCGAYYFESQSIVYLHNQLCFKKFEHTVEIKYDSKYTPIVLTLTAMKNKYIHTIFEIPL